VKKLSLIPLICYGLIVGFAVYATAVIGHWPYYSHPDPKRLPISWFALAAGIVCLAGMASVVMLPLVYGVVRGIAAWRKRSPHPLGWAPLAYAIGSALWVLDVAAEFKPLPWHSLTSWVLD